MQIRLNARAWRGVMVAAAVATGAALAVAGRAVAQQQNFDNVQIDTVKVRDNVYMLVGAGGNTTVFTGDEGILVVDTQFAPLSTKSSPPSARSARGRSATWSTPTCTATTSAATRPSRRPGARAPAATSSATWARGATGQARDHRARERAQRVLSAPPAAGAQAVPFALWPTETFFGRKREFLFNGEAVQIIHQPKAHTDGDSVVFFRKSDVVATGDLFTTVMYPFIDVANGGTITGEIDALNAILDITVPSNVNEGGTMVIPGHGRLCPTSRT